MTAALALSRSRPLFPPFTGTWSLYRRSWARANGAGVQAAVALTTVDARRVVVSLTFVFVTDFVLVVVTGAGKTRLMLDIVLQAEVMVTAERLLE